MSRLTDTFACSSSCFSSKTWYGCVFIRALCLDAFSPCVERGLPFLRRARFFAESDKLDQKKTDLSTCSFGSLTIGAFCSSANALNKLIIAKWDHQKWCSIADLHNNHLHLFRFYFFSFVLSTFWLSHCFTLFTTGWICSVAYVFFSFLCLFFFLYLFNVVCTKWFAFIFSLILFVFQLRINSIRFHCSPLIVVVFQFHLLFSIHNSSFSSQQTVSKLLLFVASPFHFVSACQWIFVSSFFLCIKTS